MPDPSDLANPSTRIRRFTVYRTGDLSATHNADQVNPADQPQFEGVVFTDGTVAVRWLTAARSTSVWADFETLWKIHGHDDPGSKYETRIVWHDDDRSRPAPGCDVQQIADGLWVATWVAYDAKHAEAIADFAERTAMRARERKAELLVALAACRTEDAEVDHRNAEKALVAFIDDSEIATAYNAIKKWYS